MLDDTFNYIELNRRWDSSTTLFYGIVEPNQDGEEYKEEEEEDNDDDDDDDDNDYFLVEDFLPLYNYFEEEEYTVEDFLPLYNYFEEDFLPLYSSEDEE